MFIEPADRWFKSNDEDDKHLLSPLHTTYAVDYWNAAVLYFVRFAKNCATSVSTKSATHPQRCTPHWHAKSNPSHKQTTYPQRACKMHAARQSPSEPPERVALQVSYKPSRRTTHIPYDGSALFFCHWSDPTRGHTKRNARPVC